MVAAVIPHSSATLSCPSHAESCRKQLPCQQPHINNHTLQQRRQRWKQCVRMFVCAAIAVKTVLVCIYNTWSQRERERERCVHVSSHFFILGGVPQLPQRSFERKGLRVRVCVCTCVCTSSFSIFSVERRDCSCWNRRSSSACTCGSAVIWLTWNIDIRLLQKWAHLINANIKLSFILQTVWLRKTL